jgi:hypothetical protein
MCLVNILPAKSVFQPRPKGKLGFSIPLIVNRQVTACITNQTEFAAKNEQKKPSQDKPT